MKISWITRRKSFEEIKPQRKIRYQQILERLAYGNKTAKEVAVELFKLGFIDSAERNYTAPRLTELEKMGYVEETAKKQCEYTGKMVTVYKLKKEGFETVKKIEKRKAEILTTEKRKFYMIQNVITREIVITYGIHSSKAIFTTRKKAEKVIDKYLNNNYVVIEIKWI